MFFRSLIRKCRCCDGSLLVMPAKRSRALCERVDVGVWGFASSGDLLGNENRALLLLSGKLKSLKHNRIILGKLRIKKTLRTKLDTQVNYKKKQ